MPDKDASSIDKSPIKLGEEKFEVQ